MAEQGQENFRDTIGTLNNEGDRAWVFPKKPDGKWYEYRKYVSYILLIFLERQWLSSRFFSKNQKRLSQFSKNVVQGLHRWLLLFTTNRPHHRRNL